MGTAPESGPGAGRRPDTVRIRLEAPGAEPGVRHIHERAFPGPEEAAIVDAIRRESPEGWQSVVAVDEEDRLVGHALLSPCPVRYPEAFQPLA